MPAIAPDQLDCAVYLYRTEAEAEAGIGGGCGFLVGLPGNGAVPWHTYVVTNKHVVEDAKSRVLRINTTDGKFTPIPTRIDDWTRAATDDVAVYPIELEKRFKVEFIKAESFLPKAQHIQPKNKFDGVFDLSVGDVAVMIGRMVTHEGKQRNRPIARFGNIAMFPDENDPIQLTNNRTQVGFLIDCRSLPGASGSAVLAYLEASRPGGLTLTTTGRGWLLGIDCAHLPRWAKVYEPNPEKPSERIETQYMVEMNSGVAVVVPAWRIMALLNDENLMKERKAREQMETERDASEREAVQDAVPETEDFTKEDFLDALKRVSRKQSEPEKS